MFQAAQFELARLEHNLGNNDWHEMNEVSSDHDAAGQDPERQWARGRIYRCSICEDEVRVALPDPTPVEGSLTEP